MKNSKSTTLVVIGLALLLATSAFAANKGSLAITDQVSVAGKQLKPGDYKVSWNGSGTNVEVSIMKGKEVVATVPAHVVDLARESQSDSAVLSTNTDGSKTISEIRFSGKKTALALGGESAKADMGDSSK